MKRPVVLGALLVLPLLFSITIYFPDILDIFEDMEDFPMEVQEVKKGPPVYVGGKTCVTCHTNEFEQWSGSHHDLAMQEATQDTVLGDFNNTTFTNFGLTSTFSQNDGRFFVRTDGPDGKLQDYEIQYTFGVTPLQQYLIEFPGGRYQVLGIAWDTRPVEEGGQRWFHLYPDEKIPHDDILHWTGPNQNWNSRCAECHSTNLRKNYDLEHDRYETTWSEIDVSCEACHGPGSNHVQWADALADGGDYPDDGGKGLLVRLKEHGDAEWTLDPEKATATRREPLPSHVQSETCARCHSRRRVIHDDYIHGRSFLDTHIPSLLVEGLYHRDGQIQDEVYVYGSFLQSKMYSAGVTCSDCHEPHSLELYDQGNGLCTRCHRSTTFNTPSHHFHEPESPGAQCVACHMPANVYMVVDPRRDHSLRIPRPDLSLTLQSPNACNQCHKDRSTQWAVDAVTQWYGSEHGNEPHFGEVLQDGRAGTPKANSGLASLMTDPMKPGIVRASAVALLRPPVSPETMQALLKALEEKDPLIRSTAVSALEILEPEHRLAVGPRFLQDPVRAVRIEAARVLASVPPQRLNFEERAALDVATTEFIDSQLANAEQPGSHGNLGLFYADRGQFSQAEAAYRKALQLESSFYPALVNLADLYRLQSRDQEGETILRQALKLAPDDANVHHALGLLLVRLSRKEEALEFFRQAATLQPDDPRHTYVYGIALNSMGRRGEAITVLEEAHHRHATNPQILQALLTLHRDQGNEKAVSHYAEKLQKILLETPANRRVPGPRKEIGNR